VAEPAVSDFTARWYARLPGEYRDADAGLDWPLLRFLSLLGDQGGDVLTLLERIDYRAPDDSPPGEAGDTSDLADPATADVAWLPWLAQLVGVVLDPALSVQERRDLLASASSGWRIGTKAAVADAVRTRLSGTKYVEVHSHSTEQGVGSGGAFDVLIVTLESETIGWFSLESTAPTWADVEALGSWDAIEEQANAKLHEAVIAAGAKPAGVRLWWAPYRASWDVIEAAYPTWADVEAAGSWSALQEVGA
jgi:hypothetical protein